MATFYLDYEGGNDANAGTSFATRWKTITNGATAARIAPGDTIRIMASPDPTSLGVTGVWTGGGRPNAVNIASSTSATPIAITTSAAHGLSAGDYVSVASHNSNTNANGVWKVGTVSSSTTFTILNIDGTNTSGVVSGGASGNITKVNNCVVKLASPLTKNIALCGGLGEKPAWTASTNVTTSQETGAYKEGYSCTSIAVNATFTTGLAAYYALPSTLDLSSYQQVTFWVRQASGTIGAAGAAYLALCTDTTGATVAHQCNIPALGVINAWMPVTVDLGTNLNSAIKSVAFYIVTDNGAQTFLIDNIVACKAASSNDSLSLASLISKSDGTGDEAWYALQSINYDVVMLGNDNGLIASDTSIRGYNGTSETVTTYKRETIKTVPATSGTTAVQTVNDNGTAGSPITFSGGWNRTDMSTQTGQTWWDGQNGNGNAIYLNAKSYFTFDRVNLCRYYYGLRSSLGDNITISSMYATSCSWTGLRFDSSSNSTITSLWCNNNREGASLAGAANTITTVKTAENCYSAGILFTIAYSCKATTINSGNTPSGASLQFSSSRQCVVGTLNANNGAYSVFFQNSVDCYVNGGSSTGALTACFYTGGVATGYFNNFTMNETVEAGTIALGGGIVYSNRHDNTDNNSWVFTGGGTINQQSSVVDSPATTAWKMNPTSLTAVAANPIKLKLGTVVCGASSLVTVTARMRRDDTGLTMRLCCPGGQISGVSTDVTSDMTAAANTWETVTITFTPTKAGGVDIYAYAYGGTTYSGYVCNLTASQA